MRVRGSLLLALTACCLLATATADAADPGWTRATLPAGTYVVNAVSADSASDVWAVASGRTILRYDGVRWAKVGVPSFNGKPIYADDVSAIAPDDVWVLGTEAVSGEGRAVTAHWNGSAWTVKQIARPDRTFAFAMAGVRNTRTAWLVGGRMPDEDVPVAEFFDGTAYHRMVAPGNGEFDAVAVHSPSDVWAVGESSGLNPEMIDRWNGTAWHAVTGVHRALEITSDVAVVPGSNHAWVVGSAGDQPFAEFFGGKRWTQTPVPMDSNAAYAYLTNVVAISGSNAWAIGQENDSDDNPVATLLVHWNGRTWTRVPFPEAAPPAQLISLTASRDTGELWAGGLTGTLTQLHPLILHHPG